MKVLVIGLNGLGLMPTTPRKARLLVKAKKAIVARRNPYTIRLLYKTGTATQPVTLGIDTGSQHIGIAIVTPEQVLSKTEYALRQSMEKRALLEKRREARRSRRYRKTPYRRPKFRHHTKRVYSEVRIKRNKRMTHWIKIKREYGSDRPTGWLPPSIQSKLDIHERIIRRYLEALPPGTRLNIEKARFDIARMKDPEIHGELYQKGRMYDYENVKAYVFARDGYKCRVCGRRAGSKREDGSIVKLHAHHIDFRSRAATDNPDRMASVCTRCHSAASHKTGGILYQWMEQGKAFARGYRDATFVSIISARLAKAFPEAVFTYGNITKADREEMGLAKSHANDAAAIASHWYLLLGKVPTDCADTVYVQQVRNGKRSLHEMNPRKGRKVPNRAAKRNAKNTASVTIRRNGRPVTFCVYDKVSCQGKTGWISGFTGTAAYVKDRDDEYIRPEGKSYSQVNLSGLRILSRNHNWLIGARAHIGS